jgi:hypothetical protein
MYYKNDYAICIFLFFVDISIQMSNIEVWNFIGNQRINMDCKLALITLAYDLWGILFLGVISRSYYNYMTKSILLMIYEVFYFCLFSLWL